MAKRKRRQLIPTTWIGWTPEIARLFHLAPDDWTPPNKVRICGTIKRCTWSARYRTPAGVFSTVRVRIEQDADGVRRVSESSLSMRLVMSGAAR